jgi:hypothetical protein
VRVLARRAPLDRTLIVSLNGGEERGQLGAVSVLKHPWVKDAHAYIYLEALPGGRAVLIGSGPGNPWLARTFARAARLPLGNVLVQELAQSRLLVVQAGNDQTSALLLAGEGVQGTEPLVPVLSTATPAPPSWPPLDGFMEPFKLMLPAGEPPMPAPKAEVAADAYDPTSDTRRVSLHLHGTSPELRLSIPAASLLGWSASAKLPPLPADESDYRVMFEGIRDDGVDFQLTLRGSQPVDLILRGIDGKRPATPEIQALGSVLPKWVTLRAFSYRMTRIRV